MQQTIHGDYIELTAFVFEHLCVCLHNPFTREAICCIHQPQKARTRSTVSWAIAWRFFWEGCAGIPFLSFSSLADPIKYFETSKYLKQYFQEQESETKVNICNYSVFEAVTNSSFIAACSLSSSSVYSWHRCHILGEFLHSYIRNICSRNILLVHI